MGIYRPIIKRVNYYHRSISTILIPLNLQIYAPPPHLPSWPKLQALHPSPLCLAYHVCVSLIHP